MGGSIFGQAIIWDRIRLHRSKWWPFQPRNYVMAPDGHIWFHPDDGLWREDFSTAHPRLQALLIHELTHVWQHQRGLYLILRRHPLCRYAYTIQPGRPLQAYGIEQQAMIVEHAFTARHNGRPRPVLEALLRDAGLAAAPSLREA
ncbi:vgr related protein [Sphingomonas sp.]|uniref:vgr related protein n=1 Tax=Sphingomonas sp. TaxID=28214 RepID=UPI003B3B6ADB